MAVTISALSLPAPRCDRNSPLPWWIGDNFSLLQFLFAVWPLQSEVSTVDSGCRYFCRVVFLGTNPGHGTAPPEFHLAKKASRLTRRWLALWQAARNRRTCRSLQLRRFPKHLPDSLEYSAWLREFLP